MSQYIKYIDSEVNEDGVEVPCGLRVVLDGEFTKDDLLWIIECLSEKVDIGDD